MPGLKGLPFSAAVLFKSKKAHALYTARYSQGLEEAALLINTCG
jgi:hypothetical protein